MDRSDLLRRIARETALTGPDAEATANSVLSGIAGSLARGEVVSLSGTRTFGTRRHPARTGHNPGTGETLDISASTVAAFKVGKPLRDVINGGGP